MNRILSIITLIILFLISGTSAGYGAGDKTLELRKLNNLIEYKPEATFLNGNFIAEEMNPAFIFGTVGAFAGARKCPVSWLIEDAEKARLEAGKGTVPFEYTLYLEEECKDAVTYYVFIDQRIEKVSQWMEWRRQFHKSKAANEYGETEKQLERAIKDGVFFSGELRFIVKNGSLTDVKPADYIMNELKFAPIYDLKNGRKIGK